MGVAGQPVEELQQRTYRKIRSTILIHVPQYTSCLGWESEALTDVAENLRVIGGSPSTREANRLQIMLDCFPAAPALELKGNILTDVLRHDLMPAPEMTPCAPITEIPRVLLESSPMVGLST
jgi:hypothetical protein